MVVTERPHEHVALVRLNRPKVLNALSNARRGAARRRARDARRRRPSRARSCITGDDRAFAAGADIAEFAAEGPQLEEWDRLWALGLPMIAAVRGLALGGGLELAMSCDLMVVADDARLGQPEINLGVMPGAGGTQRLTRAVGKTLATEMVLLGRELSGREAELHGLANRCGPGRARAAGRARAGARAREAGAARGPRRRSARSRRRSSSRCTRRCSTSAARSTACCRRTTRAKASPHFLKNASRHGSGR